MLLVQSQFILPNLEMEDMKFNFTQGEIQTIQTVLKLT